MQPITLTTEQRGKLLEMANKLFPEQIPFCIGLRQEIRKGWGYSKDFVFGKSDTFEKGIIIHWFEFCMTELNQKLSSLDKTPNPKNALDLNHFLVGVMYKTIHPVDYLYNKFKKLT